MGRVTYAPWGGLTTRCPTHSRLHEDAGVYRQVWDWVNR